MRSLRNEYLILIGVIGGLALFGLLLFFAITATMRQASRESASRTLTPAAQEENLQTRAALLFMQTPTVLPDPITVIHEIRTLARLETIQYTLEKVISVEEGQNELAFLFGDKLLFVGHGRVIAGVDLSKMRPEDMRVEGQTLYVRLPPAEVFIAALDNEKSYVYNRETGLLTKGDVNLETTARTAAEREILKAALDDGILGQAQRNAESYMSRMLRGLGYPEVIFVNDATPAPEGAPQLQVTPPAEEVPTSAVPVAPTFTPQPAVPGEPTTIPTLPALTPAP